MKSCKTIVALSVLLWVHPSFAQNSAEPPSFSSHVQKAQSFLQQKRPDLAIPELRAAVALDPANVEIQGNLGVLLYFQGALAEAIPHLRVALEKQPDLSKIQGLLGMAELHTSDTAAARKDLAEAFPLVQETKFKVQVGLELVGLYTRGGQLEEAAAIVAQLRKDDPSNAEVLYAAYRTYADLSSESMLALALAAPDSAQMHQLLAHEQIKQGNTNDAVSEYRKAIAINQHLPGVHFELAELLNTSSDPALKKQAEEEYRVALTANPFDEKPQARLAEIDSKRGDTHQAFEEYSKAVEMQPADADAQLGLAQTLTDMNQLDKALLILEHAVQLEPTNATAHYRLGTLYRKLGRPDDAKREMDFYQKCKDMKDKLRATYKGLLKQPNAVSVDEPTVP